MFYSYIYPSQRSINFILIYHPAQLVNLRAHHFILFHKLFPLLSQFYQNRFPHFIYISQKHLAFFGHFQRKISDFLFRGGDVLRNFVFVLREWFDAVANAVA